MQEIWVVWYSPEQDAIHIDTLGKILSTNRRNIINGVSPGYVPIFLARTHDDAHDLADVFLKHLKNNAQEPF